MSDAEKTVAGTSLTYGQQAEAIAANTREEIKSLSSEQKIFKEAEARVGQQADKQNDTEA